jgi:hypothetical protein
MTICEEILNWFKERYPDNLNLDEFKVGLIVFRLIQLTEFFVWC